MRKLKLILIFTLLIFAGSLQASIFGKYVYYKAGKTKMVGYIAYSTSIKGKRPGVIIVPDWWGQSRFARNRAHALAALGYTAIVMDIYGNGKKAGPASEAKELMNKFTADPVAMKKRFLATRKVLRKHRTVNGKIGAIGYSLGGMVVIEMARQGVRLDGVASFWGVIGKAKKPARKGRVKARILVLHPGQDGWAPEEAVQALHGEMKTAGAYLQVVRYKGTKHGFSRLDADEKAKKDNLPLKYDAAADKKSWDDMHQFLQASFK